MRLFIFTLVLFFSKNSFAGCTGPRVKTNNGVDFSYYTRGSDTIRVNPIDSFIIMINGGNCYVLNEANIVFNGDTIYNSKNYSCSFKLPAKPGLYKIFAVNLVYQFGYWTIIVLPKPKIADTLEVEQTALLIQAPNPEFQFYPNPSRDEITFSNETNQIKEIIIYNSAGEKFGEYKIDRAKVTIPLQDYPIGIYYIHVATLSDKIIIKKIIVE